MGASVAFIRRSHKNYVTINVISLQLHFERHNNKHKTPGKVSDDDGDDDDDDDDDGQIRYEVHVQQNMATIRAVHCSLSSKYIEALTETI